MSAAAVHGQQCGPPREAAPHARDRPGPLPPERHSAAGGVRRDQAFASTLCDGALRGVVNFGSVWSSGPVALGVFVTSFEILIRLN